MIRPHIFICIPLHNRAAYTQKCLSSIFRQNYRNFTVIACNDGSTDSTAEVLKKNFPAVIVEEGDGNLWWTGAINVSVRKAISLSAPGDYIYTLNNDTELFSDTLERLVSHTYSRPNAIIGTLNLFYYEPIRIENSAFILKSRLRGLVRFHKWGQKIIQDSGLINVDTLTGKGTLIPVRVFYDVGYYEEKKLPHYHADIEFVLRAARAGFRVYLSYEARLLSHQEQSGIGAITTEPRFGEFIRSFSTIRSTHHLPSLTNYLKLVYGRIYLFHLVKDLIFINLGFIKRFIRHKLSRY